MWADLEDLETLLDRKFDPQTRQQLQVYTDRFEDNMAATQERNKQHNTRLQNRFPFDSNKTNRLRQRLGQIRDNNG